MNRIKKEDILTIHQPEHMPWLGFFNKMAKAGRFVILDNVPFRKNYFQNRNKIMGTNQVQWLSVPVVLKGHIDSSIRNTEIASENNPKWKEKYLKNVVESYKKYPYFDVVMPVVEKIFESNYRTIFELNFSILSTFAEKMGISTQFIFSSDLQVEGNKSDLILDICKKLNVNTYLAGPSGRDYLNVQSFDAEGIVVKYNDYHHPTYAHKKADLYEPYLSTLDLFMNHGFSEGFEIIMNGNEYVYEANGTVYDGYTFGSEN